MTERGLPSVDGSPACPFVAFEDDRDERAARPDHRHRCFADAVPAPRALAHQEAYCLSSAFPVCPTFQEWARREAAHANRTRAEEASDEVGAGVGAAGVGGGGVGAVVGAGAAGVGAAGVGATGSPTEPDDSTPDDDDGEDLWSVAKEVPPEDRPRRNPPRDWAAPPPWAGGSGGPGRGGDDAIRRSPRDADPASAGQGLAGSAADRLASGGHLIDAPATPPDPELASLVSRLPRGGRRDEPLEPPVPHSGRRPAVSSTRDRTRERERERERERAVAERVPRHDGPSWERERRFEAYPSLKTRAGLTGMPQVPRVGVLAIALVVAALALFLLPGVLNIGGEVGAPGASPSASTAAESPSLEPTVAPAPTPQTYTIKSGDTLTKIARRFSLTIDQLLAANKDTIKNPNRISVGDTIIIPLPPGDGGSGSGAPAASPSG
jgi:LysM repeat protein